MRKVAWKTSMLPKRPAVSEAAARPFQSAPGRHVAALARPAGYSRIGFIEVFDEAKTGCRIVCVVRQTKQRDRPESAVDDASRFQFAPAFRIHPGGDSESRLACFVAGAINFEFRDRFFAWGSPSQDVLAVAFGVSKDLVSLCFSVRIELIGGEGGYERVARLQPALAAGPTPALPGNFPHRWVPMMTSSAGAPR
jgi:hypothetical protein